MKLEALLKGIKVSNKYDDVEIKDVSSNSQTVKNDSVFVCIKGRSFDSHIVAPQLEKQGVRAFVVEHDVGVKNQIIVENTRKAYAVMCSNLHGIPSQSLKIIGITGTNGKTTTANLIKNILEDTGHKTGLIGTIEYTVGDDRKFEGLTTPTSEKLSTIFAEMVKNECEYCVMEVSSQALAQQRVFGVQFECAVFTNLTQDHLDYHEDMQTYAEAKKELFKNANIAIINLDDEYAKFMTQGTECRVITYSTSNCEADYTAENIKLKNDSVQYEFVGNALIGRIHLGIPGKFSVYNSMAAASCTLALGIPLHDIIESLSNSKGVSGRAQVLKTDTPFMVMIDYAHSPDSLKNILSTLHEFKIGNIITVFGCGGDRDKSKRPQMGEISAMYSDIVVVTSDNPRTENPGEIIQDILVGMQKVKCIVKVVENRAEAIEYALNIAKPNDIVLLAGKGHENYQIIGTEKVHFDERD
ncbi:MAG: UDP-N-acetylmuramoyl-L-alanyl-D-glutamate--2,6-diaminopimelate ligase [Oscillospiraceae bacterium]